MKPKSILIAIALITSGVAVRAQQDGSNLNRTALPIAEPKYPPITELDVRKVKAPPLFEVKAPKGAPNVMVILLDNFGYAGSTTFGGSDEFADAGSTRQKRIDL